MRSSSLEPPSHGPSGPSGWLVSGAVLVAVPGRGPNPAFCLMNQMSDGLLMSVPGSTDRQLDPNDGAVLDAAD
jgi:hypothetical protein